MQYSYHFLMEKKKIAIIWLCIVMIFNFVVIVVDIPPPVKAAIITVDDSGGADFTKIQDGINASDNGDTILVYNGTYHENVVVNKTINLTGENRDKTVIDGGGNGDVVRVIADWVNLSGFMVMGGGPSFNDAGIELYHVENCSVFNNNVSSNIGAGISIFYSDWNNITGNHVYNNQDGIHLQFSSNNSLFHNNASSNIRYGVYVFGSDQNVLIENNASFYNDRGIWISSSNRNNLTRNNASLNYRGICVSYSSMNIVEDNIASYNNMDGIYLDHSNRNNIIKNTVFSNNQCGIDLTSSSWNEIKYNNASNNSGGIAPYMNSNGNNITGNIAANNSKCGIWILYSEGNNLTNNIMLNNGVFIEGYELGQWNTHFIDDSNTVNGYPIYYLKNQTQGIVPSDLGQVILANCTYIRIEDQKYSNTSVGIELGFSSNIDIIGNNVSMNKMHGIYLFSTKETNINNNIAILNSIYGIYLSNSHYNYISCNVISESYYGFLLMSSSQNYIFHNNVKNNTYQAYNDNDNYWDNGYPSGGNYWSDYSGNDNFKGPNQDIPGNDGIGDTNYSINFNSFDNYPLIEPYPINPIPLNNYIILKQGWNLISLPLIQEEKNLTIVLDSIDGLYDTVEFYNISDQNDHWKINNTGKPFGNDLFELKETMGIWIYIIQPGTTIFLYNGTQLIVNQTIELHPGWNLVGYPSKTNKNRTDALNNVDFGSDVDAIWTYNATTQKWKEITASDNFEVGRGYWTHSKVTKTWIVPL